MVLIQLEIAAVIAADGLNIYFGKVSVAAAASADKLVVDVVAFSAVLVYDIFAVAVVATAGVGHEP